jgi:hypothetical protein
MVPSLSMMPSLMRVPSLLWRPEVWRAGMAEVSRGLTF